MPTSPAKTPSRPGPMHQPFSDRTAAIFALSRSPSLQGLTTRLVEVAWMIGDGQPDKRIAAHIGVSSSTIRKYRARIVARLGIDASRRTDVLIAERVILAWTWIEEQRVA